MFDLEQHVKSWGDYLRSKGMSETDVIELESHLLDQVDDLAKNGLSTEEAFIISVKRLGNVNMISEEYSKINTENLWKHLLLEPIDATAKSRSRNQIIWSLSSRSWLEPQPRSLLCSVSGLRILPISKT